MEKNYYKTSCKFDDMVRAIATQIERGIDKSDEAKWDEGVVRMHTDMNHYEIRLTDRCEDFEDGCVLIVGGPKDHNIKDFGMLGKWMDYDAFAEDIAERLLSYVDNMEGENYDWLDRARLSNPKYGAPNRVWMNI